MKEGDVIQATVDYTGDFYHFGFKSGQKFVAGDILSCQCGKSYVAIGLFFRDGAHG